MTPRGPWVALVMSAFAGGCRNDVPANACARAPDPGHWRDAVVAGWPALEPGLTLGQVAGLAVEPAGSLLVFRRANHPWFGGAMTAVIDDPTLLRLDAASGAVLARFGQARFAIPHGLHTAADGSLWVTDVGTHRVYKLAPSGDVLLALGSGQPGKDRAHSFDQPTDVFVAADGTVFIADGYGNSRIVALSPAGDFLREWGTHGAGPGQLDTPHSISGDGQGRLYVADRGNARVQRFDGEGRFLDEWRLPALGRPWAVTVAADGFVYVVDGGDQNSEAPDHSAVIKLDQSGQIVDRWSEFGQGPGQLCWGHDVAVDAASAVYVGDVYHGQRVQKFRPR